MTRRDSPRGEIWIGSHDEITADEARQWRERSPQERLDIFLALMQIWHANSPGLEGTIQTFTVP